MSMPPRETSRELVLQIAECSHTQRQLLYWMQHDLDHGNLAHAEKCRKLYEELEDVIDSARVGIRMREESTP